MATLPIADAGHTGQYQPENDFSIEVLGIHARDEAERRRYAARWAAIMYEDAGRILAFQHAYDEAVRRLYPGETMIDIARLPDAQNDQSSLQTGDRILLFTRPDCAACDVLLKQVLDVLDRVAGVDIYLHGLIEQDDEAVRAWASRHGIDGTLVQQRRVTLNHDSGVLARLTNDRGAVPYLLRLRNGETAPLRVSELK